MDEMDLLCRLCAQKKAKTISVFAEKGNCLEILSKITQFLQIKICPNDDLPKTVCDDCSKKLESTYEFYESCTRAQITLQADLERLREAKRQDQTLSLKAVRDLLKTKVLNARRRKQSSVSIKHVPKKRNAEVSHKETNSSDGVTSDNNEQEVSEAEVSDINVTEGPTDAPSKPAKGSDAIERIRLDKYYTWQCTDCPQILTSPVLLKEHHSQEHGQAVRYQCVECAKVYTVYRKFSRHVRLHRNHDKFKCTLCGKTFATKQSLDSHSIFHSTERPHVCEHCGKTFRQRGSLYVHRRVHQSDLKQFPCQECGKQLLSRQALETHLKSHSGARDYTCELCGKSFTVKQGLVYHMLSHSGDRPHPCQVCGMRCKTMYLLKKHMTTHSDVKKHQCDVCGKQFRERGTLLQHTRIHTGAMPYSCEFCAKSFRFQGALTIHRRQHTGERPYACSDCSRDFTNWANYNKHMKRRHGRTAKKNYADPTFYSDQPDKTTTLAENSPPQPCDDGAFAAAVRNADGAQRCAVSDDKTGNLVKRDMMVTNKLQPLVNEIIHVDSDKLLTTPTSNDYNISYLPSTNFVMNQCYLSM